MTVSESLERELDAWGVGHTTLAASARLLAAQLDAGPTERDLPLLTTELRQILKALEGQRKAQATELDAFLQRVSAPEFAPPA